jgi:hypothetical protein
VGAFYLFTKSIQMADFELPVFPEGFLDEKDYQPQQGGIEQIAANIQQAFPAAQKKKPTASSSANGSSGSASNKKKSLQDLFVKDKSKEAEIRKRLGIEEGDIAPKTSVAVSTGITQKPAATKAPASNYKITKPGVKTSMASDATAVATSEEQAPFVMPKSVGPVNIPAPERETIAAESTGLAPQVPIKKYEHPVLGPLSEDKLKEIEQQQKNVASAFSVMNFDKSLAQASGTGLTASGGAAELLNMLTPRAFKSGGLGIMGSLLSTSAAAIELFDKTVEGVGSIIGKGVFKLLGTDEVNEALDYSKTNTFSGVPVTKKLYELGQMAQGLSSAQMAAAEVNSGIADKNVGKDPVGLLTSPTEGDFMDGMTKLGLSVVQQIPNLLAITATGSVVVPTAILEGGSNITEEYKKDQDISAADGITSVAKGIVAGFIENLYVKDIKALQAAGSAIGEVSWTGAKQQLKKVFEDKGEDGVRDLINRTYGSAIKKALTGSAGESVEEILTEVSNFTIDTIRSGKFDANKFNESLDKAANAGLIGFATGGLISGPVMMASVEPLSFDQKRKVVEFNKIAADPSLSEDVRKTAQIQANKIVKENADKTSATYDLLIAMDLKKREQALTKMTEIRKMEADLEKIQDPELQKPIQEKLDKKKDELNQMKTMQLIKEMGKKAKAQAEKAATAMQGAEPAQAPVAPLEVDHTQDQTAEPILEGKSKEQVEEIKKFDKAIKSIDPKAKIVLVNSEEAFAKELEKFHSAEKARDLAQGSAGIFASNQDGTNPTVIVNTNLADASTYAHEAFHLAVTSLASKNPAKFVEMQKKILDVLNKSDSKKLTDFANSYDFSKLTEEGKQQRIAEEFLSELAGRLTSRDVRLQRSMLHDIANIIHDFIKAFNIKGLNDLADKYLGKYAQTEDLAKFFEGFATSMQKGKKIDVSYLGAKPVVLNETQKARLEGLTPGTEAYHEASRLNASQPTPLTFDPQLNNESIVDSDSDVTRQQLKEGNLTDTPEFKKYMKTVKGLGFNGGLGLEDIWMARALFSEEARGNKLYAQGTKQEIIQKMQDELAEIKAAAENSNKYYLTTLYPAYIQSQIDKFTRENAVDLRTQWEMIRDSNYHKIGFIDQTAEIQKSDLLSSLNYLIGNDTYSVPFQYAMIKDLIGSRYEIADAETQEVVRKSIKPSQYNTTERSFNSLQPDIIALTYNEYGNKLANAGEAYQYASLNKPKVDLEYSDLKPYIFKESSTGEGTWLKFPQGNDPVVADHLFKIANTSHKYPAKWCTGTKGTAADHLSTGDFYIFVDGNTGDARIAVRYNGTDKISEVRGLGEGQSVLAADDDILKEVVDTFPDGEGYAKDALAQKMGKEVLSKLDADSQYILSSERMENVPNATFYNDFKNAFINLADKYNIEDFLDLTLTEDRSYNAKNYLLSNLKFAVNQFMPFLKEKLGIKPGELILNVGDMVGADFSKIKYFFPTLNTLDGDLRLSNNGKRDYNFPELLRATYITVDGGYNFNAPKLKKADTISIYGNSKLVANNLEGSIFFNKYDENVTFEANKLAAINLAGSIAIEKGDSFILPSVKKINSKSEWSNFGVTFKGGDFSAENLAEAADISIVGQYYDNINDHIKIPNLESIGKLSINNRKAKSEILDFDKLENKNTQLRSLSLLGNVELNAPNLKSISDGSIVGIVVGDGAELNADKLQGSVKNLTVKAENATSEKSAASLNSLDSVENYFEILNSSLSANKLQNAGKDFLVRSSDVTLPNLKSAKNIEVRANSTLNLPSFIHTPTEDNYSPSVIIRGKSTLNAGDIEILSKLDISGESNIIAPNLKVVLADGIELNHSDVELPSLGIARKIYLSGSKLVAPKLSMILSKDENGNNEIEFNNTFIGTEDEEGFKGAAKVESQLIAPKLGYIDPNESITRQQITRLAPNGKPSNLDEKQYNTVRTPQFKDWFGDWENDPANASKFVDENGEPQVVYHGTNAEFDQFDLDQKRFEVHDKGIFFTPELSAAKQYGEIQMPVFLNAKTLDFSTMDRNDSFTQLRAKENELLNNTTAEGVVLTTSDKEGSNVKQFVVFDPNQAKSATGNVGTFSTESDNIRQQKANLWDGTRSARQVSESKAKERKDLKSLTLPKNIYKELFERNANIAEALKKAGMEETFYMLYNKAGATPYATRKFAEAQLEIFGKLSKAEKNQLNDIAQLRRVIAVDTNFENRIAEQKKNGLKEGEKALEMPKHPKFNEYGTGAEIDNNKSVAQEQLDKLKQHLGDEAFNKINDRVTKLFGAFSDILKYKYENGLINKETYDLYKDYEYIPRQFLFDIDLEDIPASAFNTRGVSITKDELAKIGRGSDEFAEVDTEKMLKMAMIAAQHRVFTNRAIQNMAKELEALTASGQQLTWLKPANIIQLKKGVDALEKDGSPKIEGADDGFRNMFYKKDGKRYAVQLKESYAKEFYDEELYDTSNKWYKAFSYVGGAKLTQTMAVGANPFFVLRNIPVDILSQVYYNNIYNGHGLGVTAQMAKGFAGTFEIMAKMAKASSKIGDNSEILNLIKEYGEAGGLMTTQTDDSTYLGKVGDVLGYLGNVSEVAAKLAAYKNVKGDLIKKFKKDNGTDPNDEQLKKIQLEAAYKARSAMDFNRGGLATKFGNGFLPFFNIQFQVAKISASYVKNNPVKFFNKISQSMGLVAGLTLYNMLVAGADWENKDLKRDKETKLIFMNPFGKNADGTLSYMALQVPAPVKFFWNIAQRIAETIHYQMNGLTPPAPEEGMREKMLAEFKKYMPNLKSSLIPPSLKAIMEYNDNEDYFYGRKLSQDHLKNIFFSQEGAENENVLTFYKVLFQGLENNTGWGFSPERVQKASESVITSPEYNALVSAMYAATEWMTDKAYKGMYDKDIDPKLKSKYLTGDYSNAMSAFFKSGVGTMFKKTDAKKNQTLKDYEKDAELKERIDYENKRINTEKIEITRYVKRLINKEKENGITLNDRRPQLSNYINRFKEDELKKYASHYIEIQLNRNKVAYKKNIPTYLTIIYEATSPEAQAIALKKAFGNSIYSNPMLKKDLKLMGFGNSVYKEAQTEEVKFAPKND